MDDLVRKRNEIIKASYRLSHREQSIILTAISKIDNDITDQALYELSIPHLAKITGISIKNAYTVFKQACFDLFERKLTLTNGSNKLTRWVQTIDYKDGEGVIKIQFSNQILPYLTNIRDNFTSYNLRHVSQFKSTYGIRVYELCCQWRNTKNEVVISLDELKGMFQLGTTYNQMSNLKKRVIDPAIKDINTFSDLTIDYENIKTGRKVTGFKFKFKPKKQVPKILSNEYIEQHARPGETYEQAKNRLSKEVYDNRN